MKPRDELTTTAFAAIRNSPEGEWLDLGTVSYQREEADRRARRGREGGAWRARNPVARIVSIVIREEALW